VGWEYLNKEFRAVYPADKISCDDEKALQALLQVMQRIYPYIRKEGIVRMIEKTCAELDAPCGREEFLQLFLKMMNKVPYRILVGDSKDTKE
jgi:hypothetical protein